MQIKTIKIADTNWNKIENLANYKALVIKAGAKNANDLFLATKNSPTENATLEEFDTLEAKDFTTMSFAISQSESEFYIKGTVGEKYTLYIS